jgi:uncharacterized protein with HEPN domain
MSDKDRLNLLSILEAIEKIQLYKLKLNDAEEVWQIISAKIPGLNQT